MIRKTLSLTAVAALTVMGAAAHAGPSPDFVFEYDRAELQSPQGRTATVERLEKEARAYCTDTRVRGTAEARRASHCKDTVVETVLESLDSEGFRMARN